MGIWGPQKVAAQVLMVRIASLFLSFAPESDTRYPNEELTSLFSLPPPLHASPRARSIAKVVFKYVVIVELDAG